MRKLFSTAIALFVTFTPVFAQMPDAGEAGAEMNFIAGIPQGTFGDHVDGEAAGVSVFFGGHVPGTMFVLGSEIGYLNYGMDSRLSLHSTVFDAGIDEGLAIPLEAVRTSVSNNILLGHLVFRISPSSGAFRPYVDALAGLKYFATRMNVESDVVVFRDGLDQDAFVTDFAFSYGVGGGLEIELYEYTPSFSRRAANVSLHGGIRYLLGTPARYALESSFAEVGDHMVVDVVESRTDLLVPQFGIRVRH